MVSCRTCALDGLLVCLQNTPPSFVSLLLVTGGSQTHGLVGLHMATIHSADSIPQGYSASKTQALPVTMCHSTHTVRTDVRWATTTFGVHSILGSLLGTSPLAVLVGAPTSSRLPTTVKPSTETACLSSGAHTAVQRQGPQKNPAPNAQHFPHRHERPDETDRGRCSSQAFSLQADAKAPMGRSGRWGTASCIKQCSCQTKGVTGQLVSRSNANMKPTQRPGKTRQQHKSQSCPVLRVLQRIPLASRCCASTWRRLARHKRPAADPGVRTPGRPRAYRQ